jgi:hypothetical protein
MNKGIFTDHSRHPTDQEIRSALGSVYPLWERLIRFMESDVQVEGKFSFWGQRKSGWNLRYRRKGKALVAFYPQKGRILAQVVLGKAQAEKACDLKLGEKVSQLLRDAPQLRDGKWISIPVHSGEDADDVEQLLRLKMPRVRRTT